MMGSRMGLVTDSNELDDLRILSEPTRDMHADLVRILCGLAAWHNDHGHGYGSITAESLRRDNALASPRTGNYGVTGYERSEFVGSSSKSALPRSRSNILVLTRFLSGQHGAAAAPSPAAKA